MIGVVLLLAILIFFLSKGPGSENVTFKFMYSNVPYQNSITFNINVDGKIIPATTVGGIAIKNLPVSDSLSINTTDSKFLKQYSFKKKIYPFSKTIIVNIEKKFSMIPATIYLYAGKTPLKKSANISLKCNDTNFTKSVQSSEDSLDVDIPDNCGTLNISATSEGFNPVNNTCDETSCMISFEQFTKPNKDNKVQIPVGNLRVEVKDQLGHYVKDTEVSIYDSRDMQDAINNKSTLNTGIVPFNSLPIGDYVLVIQKKGFNIINQRVEIKENKTTNVGIILAQKALAEIFFKFVNSDLKPLKGSFVLRDYNANIVAKGNSDTNGLIEVGIPSYNSYYIDFAPEDNNFMPISEEKIDIDATAVNKGVIQTILNKKSLYKTGIVKIRVIDASANPVKDAKIIIRNQVTGFDLLSYRLDVTDENGFTKAMLPQGQYIFRGYYGITEGISGVINVMPQEAGKQPEYNAKILLNFGKEPFKIHVFDNLKNKLSFATLNLYKKPDYDMGQLVTNSKGEKSLRLNGGSWYYYKVEKDNYLPFISESRFALARNKWDSNIFLEPIQEKDPKVNFLGVYDSLDGQRIYNLEIGKTYYVGFDIYLYTLPDVFKFKLESGKNDVVEKDKVFIINSYTSASSDFKYRDIKEEDETESNAKIVDSVWNNPTEGIYRVYYKVQIRNNSSVKLYDPISFNWSLYTDDEETPTETKSIDLLVGGKSICEEDSFCARINILDEDSQIYVDAFNENTHSYELSPNKNYKLEFDLINGLKGTDGEINNGKLEIYNALSPTESFEVVNANQPQRSFIRLNKIGLQGPFISKLNDLQLNEVNKLGVFVSDYSANNYSKNKTIHGILNITPISMNKSYINFTIIDKDRRRVVRGVPALSIFVKPSDAKDLNVITFPKLLAPGLSQNLKVKVGSNGSGIKDARVSVRLKRPGELNYHILNNCSNIKTDISGLAECHLSPSKLSLGTYIQVIVEKSGFKPYNHIDFAPDARVVESVLENDPKN